MGTAVRNRPRGGAFVALAGLAVGFGLVANWLHAPSRSGPTYFFDSVPVTAVFLTLLAYAALGAFAGYFLYRLYRRLAHPTMAVPQRLVVGFVVAFLLASAFATLGPWVAHSLASGSMSSAAPDSVASPGAGSSQPPSNSNAVYNSPGGSPAHAPSSPWIPLVTGLAILGGLALALLAGRSLLRRRRAARHRSEPQPSVSTPEPEGAFAPFEGAADRRSILLTCARLLRLLSDRRERTEELTPREIEQTLLTQFRLDRGAARELTALFEEARYSTHPLAPSEAARAGRLLRRLAVGFPPLPTPLFGPVRADRASIAP
jgi:uncharacterized protein DUF4129